MEAGESALVVMVPEAEVLVASFRDRHDPSAAAGMPAHITLLYPFRLPGTIDAGVRDSLRDCFADFASFSFSLVARRRFPGVLYLAPGLDEPFRSLTQAIWKRHPETPPYGGKRPNIVPHLTVAQIADPATLDRVASEFAGVCHDRLPIRCNASEVMLMEDAAGR